MFPLEADSFTEAIQETQRMMLDESGAEVFAEIWDSSVFACTAAQPDSSNRAPATQAAPRTYALSRLRPGKYLLNVSPHTATLAAVHRYITIFAA